MTSQLGPAAGYLAGLRDRLAADGCEVTSMRWHGHEVVVGMRTDRKARWLGSRAQLFVHAAAVPSVDDVALAEFTGWAMTAARSRIRGRLLNRSAGLVLPALISEDVRPSAVTWATADIRTLGFTMTGRPVTVTVTADGPRTDMFRDWVKWAGSFTGHVLKKAALYFP
ncbi:hypothetical protein AB0O01_06760 [Streptomyces sp. NPDC093252]|uniref:hypothetical protein n=1 Tax=Streptomyces sp. NPDC093252 TaxID=3154980 RepID=UPI00342FE563